MNIYQHSEFRERFVFVQDLGRWIERDAADQLFALREMIDESRKGRRLRFGRLFFLGAIVMTCGTIIAAWGGMI